MAVVTLRIVGIYFNAPVTVPDSGTVSVMDVLDLAVQQYPFKQQVGNTPQTKPGLTYKSIIAYTSASAGMPPEKRISALAFSHNYIGKYDFDGNGTINSKEGKTLGNKKRKAGIYTLEEFKNKENGAVLVWQYYVVEPSGLVRSRTKLGTGFELADKFVVEDKDEIIWRLVAIQPTAVANVPKDYETGPIIRTDLLFRKDQREEETQLL